MSGAPGWDETLAIFVASLVMSGFFSGCETGTMSYSRARAMHVLRAGGPGAGRLRRVEGLLRRIEDPILTCLVGTNLANVLGSAVVTVALTARWPEHGEWYATASVAVLVILFGEILPKVLYREYPERLMQLSQPPLALAMALAAPLRWALRGYTGLWNRLLPGETDGAALDRRNLAALLLTSVGPAADDPRFATALRRYLQLEARAVADLALPLGNLVTVPWNATVGHCLQVAASSGYSRLPIQGEGGLRAYVRVRDLIFLDRARHDQPVPHHLRMSLLVLDGRMSPYEVFEELRGQDRQLALVADPAGNPAGMITLEDLIETVVGSIADEFDPPTAANPREAT